MEEDINEKDFYDDYFAFKEERSKKGDICQSYVFVFTVFLIQSLISLGYFFIYYIYKISARPYNKLYIVTGSLFAIFLIFGFIIFKLGKSSPNSKHKKLKSYVFFILININKIIFENFIYFNNISIDFNEFCEINKDFPEVIDNYYEPLDFAYFEGRAYWKISMCFLYLMLIFYFYFRKEKNHSRRCFQNPEWCPNFSPNLYMILLFSFISFGIFFFLVIWTHKNSYNTFGRIVIYFIFLFFETLFMILSVYSEVLYRTDDPLKFQIDWKINQMDYTRINIIYLILEILYKYFQEFRCFRKIIENYR